MNFALALVARALRTGSYQGESSASEDLHGIYSPAKWRCATRRLRCNQAFENGRASSTPTVWSEETEGTAVSTKRQAVKDPTSVVPFISCISPSLEKQVQRSPSWLPLQLLRIGTSLAQWLSAEDMDQHARIRRIVKAGCCGRTIRA